MPELPEVETVARQLQPVLKGKTFYRVELLDSKLDRALAALPESICKKVVRLGKQVLIILCDSSETTRYLAIHLRMTGRLIWVPEKGKQLAPGAYYYGGKTSFPHLRAVFHVSGGQLQFFDTRRFGTIALATQKDDFLPQGVEPMSKGFTVNVLARLLDGSSQPLKNWLLRQDKIVGLGNIYACEILYASRLNPYTPAGSLSSAERRRLHGAVVRILRKAIDNCGTTFSDFQQSDGAIGSYQRFLKVYGRGGQPCPRCRTEILRDVQVGRSTFYCPCCQPKPSIVSRKASD